jgi:hypothetical protein
MYWKRNNFTFKFFIDNIICPLEVRCLRPLLKIFQLLLLWWKLEYPEKSTDLSQVKYIINNWGLMRKKLFWMKWCLFYFYLTLYHYTSYILRIPSFFTAKIASQISKRHLSAWNIWTFSRRAPEKYFTRLLK